VVAAAVRQASMCTAKRVARRRVGLKLAVLVDVGLGPELIVVPGKRESLVGVVTINAGIQAGDETYLSEIVAASHRVMWS